MASSTGCLWLETHSLNPVEYDTVTRAVDALADGVVDAVVHDAPLLRYDLQLRGDGALGISRESFHPQLYGFALTSDSPLRDAINTALLRRVDSDGWDTQLIMYFGQGSR